MTVDMQEAAQETTQEDVIGFTDEQQKFVDKLVGNARVKSRERATQDAQAAQSKVANEAEQSKLEADKNWERLVEMHTGRIAELEPYEAEAKAYRELIGSMLKDKVKALGETAKKAVAALPESLTALDRLTWLNQNEALFNTESVSGVATRVGTPAARKKLSQRTDKSREGHRPLRL